MTFVQGCIIGVLSILNKYDACLDSANANEHLSALSGRMNARNTK